MEILLIGVEFNHLQAHPLCDAEIRNQELTATAAPYPSPVDRRQLLFLSKRCTESTGSPGHDIEADADVVIFTHRPENMETPKTN